MTGNASGETVTACGFQGQGGGGSGSGRGFGSQDLLRAYTAQIQRKLNQYKKYPPEVRRQQLPGVVTVNFTVNSQGQAAASHLVKSSGHQALDQEAMALLNRISPIPPKPPGLNRSVMNLTVPIHFFIK